MYTRLNTGFDSILGLKREVGVYTLTDKTKVLTVRLPIETYKWFKEFNMRELLTNIKYECQNGDFDIIENALFLPESEDPDGEWVRDMAHDLNIDVKTFKRRVEGMR